MGASGISRNAPARADQFDRLIVGFGRAIQRLKRTAALATLSVGRLLIRLPEAIPSRPRYRL
jgi:hypothetical protein